MTSTRPGGTSSAASWRPSPRSRAGEAAEIGVYRYDRWGRNALECLANVQRVEDAGGAVVSVMERGGRGDGHRPVHPPDGVRLAELQSDQIGDNGGPAHASRVRRGLPADGGPRFGYIRLGRVPDPGTEERYRRDPDDPAGERYVPDPVTGPVLADLYIRYTNGEPVRSLVRWLNSDGVTTAAGARWTRDSAAPGAGLRVRRGPAARPRPGVQAASPGGNADAPAASTSPVPTSQSSARRYGMPSWTRQEARRDTPVRLRDPVHPLSGLLTAAAPGTG